MILAKIIIYTSVKRYRKNYRVFKTLIVKLKNMNLSQADKAIIYDNCIRESDQLQRRNSKIKSEYVGIYHMHYRKK
jgi:hypothetical protein